MTWLQAKLKYVAHFAYGDALPKDQEREGDFKVFGSNGAYDNYGRANTQAPVIIVGRKGSYGKVNWSDHPCFASDTTFFIDATTTHHHLRWLFYLLQTLNLDQGTDEAAVPGLSRDDAYAKKVFIPPLGEQKAIAHYLDIETAKIDQLIKAKKRLLALLDEKRRALITHAVTRGLNPDVPMRDSGVEWIGEIPKHWEILPLRRILQTMDYGISESVGSEGNIAVLRMGDVDEGEISYDNVGFVDDVDHDLILKANDLLFNRTNSLDKIGKVAIFRNNFLFPVSFASYLVRMRCNDSVIPEYLNYLLNSLPVLTWAKSNALPAIGQVNLNPNRYSYIKIPIPPIEEQLNITEYIQTNTKKIKKLCLSSEETIKLLQERRTSLITAAVTGQIKIT
ncbi:restriction endonuclease subunit S [Arthrospira platensis]|uniref:Type I RM system S subunit n=2 Tax=Oscillatoriophycideae TaxID=1301283 RepID=Q307D8_LIMPL|nr:restriction endonuclease subunit S [Arthrospira platensis]AMW27078.1 restriction endonuclease [Arthrospira platensis YZ]MBD2669961.1 restriction endonuclease subunit S [Arthrospira platensis FACHB-439]MBD2710540.1 restriction endonuclease subunit S [Arthrospira platensis FACHB-835]MDT9181950.1 restriction endonuclease subunit S [Limnospira sp. PMC 289.06]MDT9295246.1 restriction endonuclease subunit S [Arthrospira platensis PCC 7345]MDT9309794.1 restriction endonuclease subunit S [Limnospi